MITSNLYSKILIEPLVKGVANQLFIVSGYASATFVRRHLHEILESYEIKDLNLIIGMPSKKNDHSAFIQLHEDFKGVFKGYYFNGSIPVHSKVYSWYKENEPVYGYSGSANYSQYGFFESKQINQMTPESAFEIKQMYDCLLKDSTYMLDIIIDDEPVSSIPKKVGSIEPGGIRWIEMNKSVRISFLKNDGTLPGKSGLNWGQRKEKRTNKHTGEVTYVNRDPDQAYLSIKKDARKEGFLPEKTFTFTMLTDDKKVFDCVVAQDGRKAVQTTNDNSELGRYIRDRLNIPHGQFLTSQDLENYGRTDFTLIKIDEETFLFDFSV